MSDESNDVDLVRLLVNDTNTDDPVFSTAEILQFLALESGNVKRGAAQAIDTIADSEALTSKVIKTQGGVSTDGAKVADALRKRATALREQADDEEDDGYFGVVSFSDPCQRPELTQWPRC